MTGNAHWLTGVVFLAGFLGIALLVTYALREVNIVLRRRRFVCPASHAPVDAILVAESELTPYIGVRRCTPFGDGPVTCDKECLCYLNEKRAAERHRV